MNAALKEIFAFFVFLILLMDVAQYHRTPETFLLTKTLYETFEEVDAYGLDLTTVSSEMSSAEDYRCTDQREPEKCFCIIHLHFT